MVRGRTAVLVVNGFDRRGRFGAFPVAEARAFPWIELCLERVARHTGSGDFRVLVWDNAGLPEHRRAMRRFDFVTVVHSGGPQGSRSHAAALDLLVSRAADAEYVLTLDTDALPLRDGWLDDLLDRLDSGAVLAGAYRDEMAPRLRPFLHVSCLAARRSDLLALPVSFARGRTQDVGQNLSLAVERREPGRGRLSPLWRSNAYDAHFLLGGVYGDLVYHQGAGSRRARFHTSPSESDPMSAPAVDQRDERIRMRLRDAAFEDLDHLVAVLSGSRANDLGLAMRAREPRLRRRSS